MSNINFVDLPLTDFPFTVIFTDADTGVELYQETVEGPGALHIPPKPAHVRKVRVVVRFPDGTEQTA